MKNYPITATENAQTYWVSRSVAVAAFIFKYTNGDWYVLANKRGKGCPDFVGKWVCPCGYLDWDETGPQACSRETLEECGVKVRPREFRMVGIDTDPSSEHQNVTILYTAEGFMERQFVGATGGENKEVEEVKWIKVNEVDKYEWAFGHGYKITEIFDNHID